MRLKSHRGSSLVFLGFSVIIFIISYGLLFTLTPMILGVVYTLADTIVPTLDADWQATYEETEDVTQWLVPLVPTIGIFILVIKVIMVASARGRD